MTRRAKGNEKARSKWRNQMLDYELDTTFRFIPTYFDKDFTSGIPVLTDEGRKAVEEELRELVSDTI